MRGQTLFLKLVIELLKHSQFLTIYLKVQILAQGIDNVKIDPALKKVFS
jgi:hypothetical protein